MTTAPDSLRMWLRQQIVQTLTKRGSESPFLGSGAIPNVPGENCR
jgi:hypothetical protein